MSRRDSVLEAAAKSGFLPASFCRAASSLEARELEEEEEEEEQAVDGELVKVSAHAHGLARANDVLKVVQCDWKAFLTCLCKVRSPSFTISVGGQ